MAKKYSQNNLPVIPEILSQDDHNEVLQPKYGFLELFRLKNPYTRQRYWGVTVCAFFANIALSFVAGALMAINPVFGLLVLVLGIAFTWIYLATTVKRLRDAGLSLYWALLSFVPFISFFTLILYGCFSSSQQKNRNRARGVIAIIALFFIAIPVFAVAAYLVYNNQQHNQELTEQSNMLPPPVPATSDNSFHMEEIEVTE